ncbi:hypothetical protein FB451DRAFT_1175054 [Mycena latifolia]|nr:hypothetical protein FB451DRAFT_1175054 [Mycena latifolia]
MRANGKKMAAPNKKAHSPVLGIMPAVRYSSRARAAPGTAARARRRIGVQVGVHYRQRERDVRHAGRAYRGTTRARRCVSALVRECKREGTHKNWIMHCGPSGRLALWSYQADGAEREGKGRRGGGESESERKGKVGKMRNRGESEVQGKRQRDGAQGVAPCLSDDGGGRHDAPVRPVGDERREASSGSDLQPSAADREQWPSVRERRALHASRRGTACRPNGPKEAGREGRQ